MPRVFAACNSEALDIWIMPETSIFNLEEMKGKQRAITKKRNIVRIDPTDPESINAYDLRE